MGELRRNRSCARLLVLAILDAAAACGGAASGAQGTGETGAPGPAGTDGSTAPGAESTTAADPPGSDSAVDGSDSGGEDTGHVPGAPGCGFESAAFCDTFDAASALRGRAGDLDRTKWSAARTNPQLATGNGRAIGVGPATIGACRADLPAQVFPDEDTLVCDANADIASPHLLVAVGAQNYGQNSYRIRQPFDFADRTGTIAFDAEGYMLSGLLGWISLEITEDPTPLPSFSVEYSNDEGGPVPRNGVEIQFQASCPAQPGSVAVRFIVVSTEYDAEVVVPEQPRCVAGARGKLNHFEITISEQRVEVWASPYSDDGVSFEPPVLLQAADVALPLSRGWVHLTTHNHATIKYSQDDTFGATEVLDAWVARWDNVGFDGPIIDGTREFEVGDSLVPGVDAWNIPGPVVDVGYRVPAFDAASPGLELTLPGVDLSGMGSARLAVSMWYLLGQDVPHEQYVLHYRVNGHPWHERPFDAGELGLLATGLIQGELGQMLELPIGELVDGDNTLAFATTAVPQNYPPAISAIDLVLEE